VLLVLEIREYDDETVILCGTNEGMNLCLKMKVEMDFGLFV